MGTFIAQHQENNIKQSVPLEIIANHLLRLPLSMVENILHLIKQENYHVLLGIIALPHITLRLDAPLAITQQHYLLQYVRQLLRATTLLQEHNLT